MRIARIDVFAVRYALAAGPFELSSRRVAREVRGTVVRVLSDDGLTGWGEQSSIHPGYLPGLAQSTQAALAVLGPAVLGADPRQVEVVYDRMEAATAGYAYAKSALDIACWDLFGKATGLRVGDLLGGVRQEELELYTAIGIAPPDEMADACRRAVREGYRQLQIKVGGEWREDVARVERCAEAVGGAAALIVDANGGWTQVEAVQALRAIEHLEVVVEQPCATLEECAAVRGSIARPMIFDESVIGIEDLLRARARHRLDGVRLKLSRSGGITPVRRLRDLASALGLPVAVEDAGGGGIIDAAVTHLAASLKPDRLLDAHLPGAMVAEHLLAGAPVASGGRTKVPTGPGLGISVEPGAFGDPVLSLR